MTTQIPSMTDFPCPSCGSGYRECAQFRTRSLQCCKNCEHSGIQEWRQSQAKED